MTNDLQARLLEIARGRAEGDRLALDEPPALSDYIETQAADEIARLTAMVERLGRDRVKLDNLRHNHAALLKEHDEWKGAVENAVSLEAENAELRKVLAWPKDAAEETLVSVLIARECDPDISAFTQSPSGKGYSHKIWMLRQIAAGQITGTKAHRWLGYAQALCVIDGSMSLEKAKAINKAASAQRQGGK